MNEWEKGQKGYLYDANNDPEIIKAFCHSDDVAYGNMHPKLDWVRSKTLGRDGDCCDFIINVKK